MWAWVAVALFVEIYSVAMAVLAKRSGVARYGLCLIPFAAFFYADKFLPNGFTVLGIRIKALGPLAVKAFVLALAAYLYARWGISHLDPRNIVPLKQLAMVPIGASAVVLWAAIAASTLELMFGFDSGFRGDNLVCMTLVSTPVILFTLNREKKNYKTDFRRKI